MRAVFGVGVALMVGVAAAAPADELDHEETPWGLAMAAGTHFPLSSGLQLQLQTPLRVRLLAGVGLVPPAFRRAVNDALVSMDAYQSEVGDFVLQHIDDAMVRRGGLAMRPFPSSGFYVEAAYTGVTVEGGLPVRRLVGALMTSAADAPAGELAEHDLRLRTTLHMIHPQVGWEWTWGNVFVRGALGAAFTVRAESDIKLASPEGVERDVGPFDRVIEGYLNSALRRRAHVPTASLAFGYWFF